jgi:LEA14-like dessication related protein
MRIGLFICLLLFLNSCVSYKPIQFNGLNDVSFSEGNSCEPMCVSISVYNPNTFKIAIKKANVLATINKNDLGRITVKEKYSLPPLKNTELRFAVNTTKSNLATSLLKSLNILLGKKIYLQLDGKVKVKAYGLGIKVPVEESFELDYKSFIK